VIVEKKKERIVVRRRWKAHRFEKAFERKVVAGWEKQITLRVIYESCSHSLS